MKSKTHPSSLGGRPPPAMAQGVSREYDDRLDWELIERAGGWEEREKVARKVLELRRQRQKAVPDETPQDP